MAIPKAHEILNHEIIGLDAEVLKDSNSSNMCIRGPVIDETMNTVVINYGGPKRVAKRNAVFKFKLNSEAVKVEGSALQGRPEDRVKKTIKRRW
jgi:ribonuclease P protein subunit POP4